MSRSRIETFGALGLALVLASLLRLWGLDYGIPHPTIRPDEERLVGRAQTIFATGNWHPGSFFYPSLPFYLDALALHVYYGTGKLLGRYEEPRDFLFDIAVTRPGLHYRISRVVSAAAGVATILAAYALSLAAYRRPRQQPRERAGTALRALGRGRRLPWESPPARRCISKKSRDRRGCRQERSCAWSRPKTPDRRIPGTG